MGAVWEEKEIQDALIKTFKELINHTAIKPSEG